MDVIGMPEILSQCGGRRESFEILGEDLAPAAAPFPVLHRVEEGFQLIVGARHQTRSEEHTSELQSRLHLVCRLLLEKKKKYNDSITSYSYICFIIICTRLTSVISEQTRRLHT